MWNLLGRLLVAVMIVGVPPGFAPRRGGALPIAPARRRVDRIVRLSSATRCRAGRREGRLRAVVLVRVGLVRVVRLEGAHSGADSIGPFPCLLREVFEVQESARPACGAPLYYCYFFFRTFRRKSPMMRQSRVIGGNLTSSSHTPSVLEVGT